MAVKGLISQARQIRSSKSFNMPVLGTNNPDRNIIAEGQTFLEEDLNVIRKLILEITGETKWSDIPKSSLADNSNISRKQVIQPIQTNIDILPGNKILTSISATPNVLNTENTQDVGYIVTDSLTPLRGTKAYVTIRDSLTKAPILDINERTVFGVLYNNNNKIETRFFTDNNGLQPYTFNSTVNVDMMLPYREFLSNINEDSLMNLSTFVDQIGSFEIGSRNWLDFLDTSGSYIFNFIQNEDITKTLNKLADVTAKNKVLTDNISKITGINSNTTQSFGTDGATFLSDTDTVISALMKLDFQTSHNYNLSNGVPFYKVVEILQAPILEGSTWTLPNNRTYDNTNKDAMNLFVNGVLLLSDSLVGIVGGGDYGETSNTGVTFNFTLDIGDVIIAMI